MAIGRKNEKVDRSPGLALSVVTFPGTRDPQAQDPLLYLRAKLWPELATAVEQEAATYRNISALGAVLGCVEPCASSRVQRVLCSRPSAGEVTAHGGMMTT